MKKTFALLCAGALSLIALADNVEIPLSSFSNTWSWGCTCNGGTLTFTQGYGGGCVGYGMTVAEGAADWSEYDYLVVTFDPATLPAKKVIVKVEYVGGSVSEFGNSGLLGSKAIVQLDAAKKNAVTKFWVSAEEACTLTVTKMELIPAGGSFYAEDADSETCFYGRNELDYIPSLIANWDATWTPATSTITFNGEWKGIHWTFENAQDWSDYDDLYIKLDKNNTSTFCVCLNGIQDADEKAKLTSALPSSEIVIAKDADFSSITAICLKSEKKETYQIECMTLRKQKPTGIEEVNLKPVAAKYIENGQLVILQNGVKYNAQGVVIE